MLKMKRQIFATVNNTTFQLSEIKIEDQSLSLHPWSSVQQSTTYSAH